MMREGRFAYWGFLFTFENKAGRINPDLFVKVGTAHFFVLPQFLPFCRRRCDWRHSGLSREGACRCDNNALRATKWIYGRRSAYFRN